MASHPVLWYDTEFPEELLLEGMKHEMSSVKNFEVFEEKLENQLSPAQLSEVIDTRWVNRFKGKVFALA